MKKPRNSRGATTAMTVILAAVVAAVVALVLWLVLQDNGKDDKKNQPGIISQIR